MSKKNRTRRYSAQKPQDAAIVPEAELTPEIEENAALEADQADLTADPTEVTAPSAPLTVADLSEADLRAIIAGTYTGTQQWPMSLVIAEYRRRTEVAPAWSDDEVARYVRVGETPPRTSTGAWVNDITRPQRHPGAWSDAELKAWALGEIKAVGQASDQKLALELRERFNLTTSGLDPAAVKAAFNHQQSARVTPTPVTTPTPDTTLAPMTTSFIDATLARYAEAVMPGRAISEATGAQAQRSLDNLFQYVLRLEGPALLQALEKIKAFVQTHRNTLFSPSNAYRFTHHLKSERKQRQNHIGLIEMFMIITDKNRALRKQVDFYHLLNGLPPAKVAVLVDYARNYA